MEECIRLIDEYKGHKHLGENIAKLKEEDTVDHISGVEVAQTVRSMPSAPVCSSVLLTLCMVWYGIASRPFSAM